MGAPLLSNFASDEAQLFPCLPLPQNYRAALIGGALLASRVRETFPSTRITESHPKALLLALDTSAREFADKYGIPTVWQNEHERDAAIAAVCAKEGFDPPRDRHWCA